MSQYNPPQHEGRWTPHTGRTTYEVSVTRPISPAIDWVRGVLFPFDFTRWLTLTVPVFLIMCSEGGAGGNFGNPFGGGGTGPGTGGGPSPAEMAEKADAFLANHIGTVIGIGAGVFVALVALAALFSFLGSRAHFIHLDNMVTGQAAVQEPWERLGPLANSLFLLRFTLGLVGMVIGVALLLMFGMQFLSMLRNSTDSEFTFDLVMRMFLTMAGIMLILSPVFIGLLAFNTLTIDFAVPIMHRHHLRVSDAWSKLWALIRGNMGTFATYLLFRAVLGLCIQLAVGMISMLLMCLCCIGLIPVIGQAPLLPIFAFQRVYTVLYLEQFGPDWEIFRRDAPPPPDFLPGAPAY